ncbi:MAG: hypothetical protein HY907_06980 [Deltaproteobacteria bacterium]|nr:hypothetical protein [Deltaproteobacteria bacterium]
MTRSDDSITLAGTLRALLPLCLCLGCGSSTPADPETGADAGDLATPDDSATPGDSARPDADAADDRPDPDDARPDGDAPEPDADAAEDAGPPPYFASVELLETVQIPLLPGDTDFTYRTGALGDLDGDGVPEPVITVATYPENLPQPIVVLPGLGPVSNIAPALFDGRVPALGHSNQTIFADVDGDRTDDLLFSEAGIDHPPWSGALVGIALNRGSARWEDVSATVPPAAQGLRCYSLAAGDFYGDGRTRIVLPSQEQDEQDQTGLLSWTGTGWDFQQNWVPMSLWWSPENLYASSNMALRDLDDDGREDLYVSGSLTTPSHRVLFASGSFPAAEDLVTLPEGPCGHTPWSVYQRPEVSSARGGDVNQVVLADLDGDDRLDLVSITEDVFLFKPGAFTDTDYPGYARILADGGTAYYDGWLQVLRNDGDRGFTDISSASAGQDLGPRYYVALLPLDLDLDGDLDLVGHYWSKTWLTADPLPGWGSSLFFNDGFGGFRWVDTAAAFPELVAAAPDGPTVGLGGLFPTRITPTGVDGLFVAPHDENPSEPTLRALRFRATGRFHLPEP